MEEFLLLKLLLLLLLCSTPTLSGKDATAAAADPSCDEIEALASTCMHKNGRHWCVIINILVLQSLKRERTLSSGVENHLTRVALWLSVNNTLLLLLLPFFFIAETEPQSSLNTCNVFPDPPAPSRYDPLPCFMASVSGRRSVCGGVDLCLLLQFPSSGPLLVLSKLNAALSGSSL